MFFQIESQKKCAIVMPDNHMVKVEESYKVFNFCNTYICTISQQVSNIILNIYAYRVFFFQFISLDLSICISSYMKYFLYCYITSIMCTVYIQLKTMCI